VIMDVERVGAARPLRRRLIKLPSRDGRRRSSPCAWRPRHPRWLPAADGEMKRRIYKPRIVGDQSRYCE
jgi:hypothetical protein